MPDFDCRQINLQSHFGGGEVFTAFLCRALDQLGVPTTLFHHPAASFWNRLSLPTSTTLIALNSPADIFSQLGSQRQWVLTHGPLLTPEQADIVARSHLLTGIAHMPAQGRPNDRYRHYDCVFGVSEYVLQGLRLIGAPVYDAPLYGIAELQRNTDGRPIRQTSCFDWDRRKGRDRLLGWIEPIFEPLRYRPLFRRRSGISLGLVSRLTPIKQFPQLFDIIAPILATHPEFNLEVFGAGGYASVRDLRRSLSPLGDRVRFWGHQADVGAIYRQLDYLMTGLPEKEALGLNIIEAQACGTPVLAVDAAPFTETVMDAVTGLFYTDPRNDQGVSFSRLLGRLEQQPFCVDMAAAQSHLARFSKDSFDKRIAGMLACVEKLHAAS